MVAWKHRGEIWASVPHNLMKSHTKIPRDKPATRVEYTDREALPL